MFDINRHFQTSFDKESTYSYRYRHSPTRIGYKSTYFFALGYFVSIRTSKASAINSPIDPGRSNPSASIQRTSSLAFRCASFGSHTELCPALTSFFLLTFFGAGDVRTSSFGCSFSSSTGLALLSCSLKSSNWLILVISKFIVLVFWCSRNLEITSSGDLVIS